MYFLCLGPMYLGSCTLVWSCSFSFFHFCFVFLCLLSQLGQWLIIIVAVPGLGLFADRGSGRCAASRPALCGWGPVGAPGRLRPASSGAAGLWERLCRPCGCGPGRAGGPCWPSRGRVGFGAGRPTEALD